ncbi:MAG: bifunctional DNA primase/polymerase [Candidatus Taylorbacteria bacterium]|nr:bifunctional DNA primase/polymerase [Candidatus Taylorbacteria bacterium]
MISKSTQDAALYYYKLGFSVMPVGLDKKPFIDWKKYQTVRASEEEIRGWWEQFPKANVGVITGAISGIVVIDVERGGKTNDLPATVISKTGSGGSHHIYKHPGKPVFNSTKKLRELTDIRGDGGFIVAPPSVTDYINKLTGEIEGGAYEWLVGPEDADFVELPQWVLDESNSNDNRQIDWKTLLDSKNPEGIRNTTATQLAGKILYHLPPELWEFSGWATLREWNKNNNEPPLEENELRQVWESIKAREEKQIVKKVEESEQRKTQSGLLLEQIEGDENIVLFHDELKDPYVKLVINGHQEIWRVRGKQFKRWLAKSFWEKHKKTANSDTLNIVLTTIEGKACFDGKEFKLANRITWLDDSLWYDLSDDGWRVVKITTQGWSIVNMSPILFRHYAHQQAQIEPEAGGDAAAVLKFVNIRNDKQKLLFLVYLISCFVPEFPHPVLNIYGSQGSAKSTLSKVVRRLVDPSMVEVSEFPKTAVELLQKLSHHWCIFFDNVSSLPDFVSDTLCRAVTGAGFSKRELYSDDEDVIYTLKRCIGINGINLVAEKPDLLERSILLELDRVPKEERRQEKELFEEFEHERPKILGGIFDVLVKALQIKDSIHLPCLPRMADFAAWGCAIAEAMGYSKKEFLDAYSANIENQNKEVLYESFVASALIAFMEDKGEWKGTPSELLMELKKIASEVHGVNTDKEKGFPKAANILSKRLNQLKSNLAEAGIQFNRSEENHQRVITVQKVGDSTVSTDVLSQENIKMQYSEHDMRHDIEMQPHQEPSLKEGTVYAERDDSNDTNDTIQRLLDS